MREGYVDITGEGWGGDVDSGTAFIDAWDGL